MDVLDSLPADFVKPTAHGTITKMCQVLEQIGKTFTNISGNLLPTTSMTFHCKIMGMTVVFLCPFLQRCLSDKGMSMIKPGDIPDLRKNMILELHEKRLNTIPAEPIRVNKYYAVDYACKRYFGRVVYTDGFVKFKFLHSAGANKHD